MIQLPFRKRDAVILQECLEAHAKGESIDSILERNPEHLEMLQERLLAAGWLEQRTKSIAPPPQFISQSHQSLLRSLNSSRTSHQRFWRVFRVRLGYVRLALQTALLLLFCLSIYNISHQTVLLSQRALPGDLLFHLKTSLEDARLAFTFNPISEARLNLAYTNQRTLELQELLLEGSYEQVDQSLSLFRNQVQRTNQSLKLVARRDPLLAQELQLQMSASMQEQAVVLLLLVDGLPGNLRSGVEQVVLAVP